jgi:hypothetical protein
VVCQCHRPISPLRYILGGRWNDPSYRFVETDAQSPWDAPTNVRACRW